MTDAHSEAALEMMFENSDEVNLEMFSLWLKRSTFIEREVLLKEKIFLTLNEASLSLLCCCCGCCYLIFSLHG